MALRFYLSTRQRNDVAEIHARFCPRRGINQRAKTGLYIITSFWNEADGRCNISKRYNTPENERARVIQAQLDVLSERVYSAYEDNGRAELPHKWLQTIIDSSGKPQSSSPALHEQIEDYCNSRDVAPATRRKLLSLGSHLREFGKTHRKLHAETLTKGDLDAFVQYLLHSGDGRSRNSAMCRLRQLRTLVYWVGKPHPNPFDGYAIPADVYADPIYLTRDERDYLAMCDEFTAAKAVQRDIFIFQCHTGCRVSDLYALTPANIRDGWLIYTPKKTTRKRAPSVEVPLTETAAAIVEKYKGVDVKGRLLPFISTDKYNDAIRTICKEAVLTRPVMVLNPRTFETEARPLWSVVSSHTARKTFIQIAYEKTHDKRLVASMTGHSENSQAFNRYSEITRAMKNDIKNSIS